MKRIFSLITVLTMIFSLFAFSVQATEQSVQIEYFPDGSYLVTEIRVPNARMQTKVVEKYATFYSEDDVPQWKMTVMGEFLYDGNTSSCTYASGYYTIYNTNLWHFVSDSASWGVNRATYTVVLERRMLGITGSRTTYELSMYCDPNGNIS